MANEKYIDLIASYLSGNISAAQRAELLRWAESDPENQQFFEEMTALWRLTENYEEEAFPANTAAAWKKLDQRLSGSDLSAASGGSARVIPLSVRSIFLRVAAATILLAAASYGIFSVWSAYEQANAMALTIFSTEEDESKELTLPDGSIVWLNENTTLSYQERFTERIVELAGEAFFDVAHQEGNPFVITSGETQTTVLGTAFNVRAYPGEEQVEVTVQRGKVALGKKSPAADEAAEPVILEAGTTGVYDRLEDKVEKVEDQIVNADAWRTGVLELSGLKMSQALQAMERYYDVHFEVPTKGVLNCNVTSLRFENDSLKTALDGLAFMMSLEVEQPSDTLIVLKGGRPCE